MKNIKENESYLWYMARRDQMAYMKLKKKYRREVVILSIILIVIITCDTYQPFSSLVGMVEKVVLL